jgi:hypothetical protein
MRGSDLTSSRTEFVAKIAVGYQRLFTPTDVHQLTGSLSMPLPKHGCIGRQVELGILRIQLPLTWRTTQPCPQRCCPRIEPTGRQAQLLFPARIGRHGETKIVEHDRHSEHPGLRGRQVEIARTHKIHQRPECIEVGAVVNRELGQIRGDPVREMIGVTPYLRKGDAKSIANLPIRVVGAARCQSISPETTRRLLKR